MEIQYFVNRPVTAKQYIQLLQQTTLGPRRPLNDIDCMEGMLQHTNLLVSAWEDDILVGVARSVTDFHFCCYLSDLAVSDSMQSKGIGKTLIHQTFQALKKGCKLILLAAPQAVAYYPNIGFTPHNSAWIMDSVEELK